MRTRSDAWERIAATDYAVESKAVIDGVEYFDISAPRISRALMTSPLSIGNCVSASLSLSILTEDEIDKGAEVSIYARLVAVDDTEDVTEWLPFGTFYIDQRKDEYLGLLTLTCYDAMLKLNQSCTNMDYDSTHWPKTQLQTVQEIASYIGLEIDDRTAINTGADYIVSYPDSKTMSQVMGYIAGCHGGNWMITEEGKLRLVPLVSAPDDTATDAYDVPIVLKALTSGSSVTITGIAATDDEDGEYEAGDDSGYTLTIDRNPYMTDNICADLYKTFNGIVYSAFTSTGSVFDPALEIGDKIRIGDVVSAVVWAEDLTFNTGFTADLKAPDNTELSSEYPTMTATQLVQQAISDNLDPIRSAIEAAEDRQTDFESIFTQTIEATYADIYNLYAQITSTNELFANYATINQLSALYAEISEMIVGSATIEDLTAFEANILDLVAGYASIEFLESNYATIEYLDANYASFDSLVSVYGYIADLLTNFATIEDLTAFEATIGELVAGYATIEYLEANYATLYDLNAVYGDVTVLNSDVANIVSLLSGSVGTGDLQAIHITSSNVVIDDAVITNAMIASMSADKLTSGTIYTNYVRIQTAEDDTSLWIDGSLIQMSDENSTVRVQLGQDASGNYNFYIWNADGELMFDALGVTAEGIGYEVIVNDHIAEGANISESKLDMQSIASRLNDDGMIYVEGSNVSIDGNSLTYILTSMETTLSSISDLSAYGVTDIVYYYAIGDNDTTPPSYPYDDSAVMGLAVVGLARVGASVSTSEWTTTALQAGEGEYLWRAMRVFYADGHTEWKCIECLTDGYIRSQTSVLQTSLEVLQGYIESKVWMTDIIEYVDPVLGDITILQDQYSIMTQTMESIVTEVANITYILSDDGEFGSLIKQVATLEQTVEGFELSVQNITENITFLGDSLSGLQSDVSGLEGDISDLYDDLSGMYGDLSAQFASLEVLYNEISASVTEIYVQLDEDYTELSEKLTSIEQTTNGITTTISDIENTISDNYTSLSSQIFSLEETASGLTLTISDLTTVVDGNYTDLSEQIARLTLTTNGLTLSFETLQETIQNDLGDGVVDTVIYFALGDSNTVPPSDPYDDSAVMGCAVVGLARVGASVSTSEWTTTRLVAGEDQYLWMVERVYYRDGTSAWKTPVCLTDGYVRNEMLSYGSSLSILQDMITSRVWMTDIVEYTDEWGNTIATETEQRYSDITQTVDSINTTIVSIENTVSDNYSELNSKMYQLEESTDGLTMSVADLSTTVTNNYTTLSNNITTLQATTAGVEASVSSLTSTVTSNYTTLSSAISALEVTIDEILLSVSQDYVLYSDYAQTVTSLQASIQINTNSITSEVSRATAAEPKYGTCSTEEAVVVKIVNCPAVTTLVTGLVICVYFTYGNTYSMPELNVNGTGAKYIQLDGYCGFYDSTGYNNFFWNANAQVMFMYDGDTDRWILIDAGAYSRIKQTADSLTSTISNVESTLSSQITQTIDSIRAEVSGTYVPYSEYSQAVTELQASIQVNADAITSEVTRATSVEPKWGSCSTAAATAAKVVTCSSFTSLVTGVVICVYFTYANTASAPTLNVNGTGARMIANRGATSISNTDYWWEARSQVLFIYDGTYWRFIDSGAYSKLVQTADSLTSTITSTESSLSSQITQLASSISLSVSSSSSSAAIVLSVDGSTNSTISARTALARETSSVTISAGTITFSSGTFVSTADNFNVTAAGVVSITGTLTTSSGYYKTVMQSGSINFYYNSVSYGGIVAEYWVDDSSKRGVAINMAYAGDYIGFGKRRTSTTTTSTWDYLIDYNISYNSSTVRNKFWNGIACYTGVDRGGTIYADSGFYAANGFGLRGYKTNGKYYNLVFMGTDNYIGLGDQTYSTTAYVYGYYLYLYSYYGTYSNYTIQTTSDARLKHDIYDLTDQYDVMFRLLRPVEFAYNQGDGSRHLGFIAQDVISAMDAAGLRYDEYDVVTDYQDRDTGVTYYGLGYSELIGLTVYELQKTMQVVETHDDRIRELECQVAQLEAQIAELRAS